MHKLINKPPAPAGSYEDLGTFHAVWQALDVVMDFSIGHFTGLSPEAALDSGLGGTFLRKLSQLRELIKASDHSQKAELIVLISYLFAAKRNEIAHSYLDTEPDEVKFIYRGSNDAKPCTLSFREREFSHHVAEFVDCAFRFQNILNLDRQKLDEFASNVTARCQS